MEREKASQKKSERKMRGRRSTVLDSGSLRGKSRGGRAEGGSVGVTKLSFVSGGIGGNNRLDEGSYNLHSQKAEWIPKVGTDIERGSGGYKA